MEAQPTEHYEPNGRARWLKFLDLVLASFNTTNGKYAGFVTIWTLMLALHYVMTQHTLAESARDHEFFREEMRRSHAMNQEMTEAIKASFDEARQFNAEMRRRAKEAKP